MGIRELKKDEVLHTIGERVQKLDIVLKGTIRVSNSDGGMVLKTGAIIGAAEKPDEGYTFDYKADSDASVYTYDYANLADVVRVIKLNQKIAPVLASSSARAAVDCHSWYEKLRMESEDLYNGVKRDLEDYKSLMMELGKVPEEYPEVENLMEPREAEGMEEWRLEYLNSLIENDASIRKDFYALNVGICTGMILSNTDFMKIVYSEIIRVSRYREYLNEVTASFKMDYKYAKAQTKNDDEDEDGVHEIKDALHIILGYSGVSTSTTQVFEKLVHEYSAVPDKSDTSDELRKLRKEISRIFYDIYTAVFLKTLEDTNPPLEVKMFLLFGFMDENLAGAENTTILANFAKNWRSDPEGHVVTIREWLKLVFDMKVNPSKNEFDSDYIEYLREQVTGGYITRDDEAAFKNDRMKRLRFEIENFFTMGNRLTFGRVTTFIPIFTDDAVVRPLRTALITPDKVKNSLDAIREIYFSLFYRDSMIAFEDLEINQFMESKEVLPYVILMPNMGSRTSMWQEIDGKKRDTPARMMMSILFTEDLDDALTKLCGEFRWEMCRRIQGVHWNDVTDPSLTSEYCDYLQFYRKNHDISPESREKIKLALQKSRNNYRSVFVSDYMAYIRNEATGSARLNKVARGIVFRYCPFRKEKREAMKVNPLYGDLVEKYGIKQSGKVRLIQVMIQKINKMEEEVPDKIKRQLDYLRT